MNDKKYPKVETFYDDLVIDRPYLKYVYIYERKLSRPSDILSFWPAKSVDKEIRNER